MNLVTFLSKSSHQRCSVIKGVVRNFAKFIGKHQCRSLFFNKVAGLRPVSWLISRFDFNFISQEPLFFFAANIYLFKVNSRNTRKRCEISSELTIETPERRHWRSGIFIVNLEQISHLFLVFLLLSLKEQMLAGLYHYNN